MFLASTNRLVLKWKLNYLANNNIEKYAKT
jgi:hypothetical protein